MNWKTLSSDYISNHQYFTARKDACEMPDGRIVPSYFVVELPVSVCALAITEEGKVILVNQYRHPVGDVLTEIPGGFIDEGEDPQEAIGRELLEETGYAFSKIDYVGKVAANPGLLNSYTYLFLAKGGKKIALQELDHNEEIEIDLVTIEELKQMIRENKIVQSMHVTCIMYALDRMGELRF